MRKLDPLDYEEFLARAKAQETVDDDIAFQLRQLYVDGGTLLQLVHHMLDTRDQLREALAKTAMVDDNAIRRCIGLQGQVTGIDTALGVIHTLMNLESPNADGQ